MGNASPRKRSKSVETATASEKRGTSRQAVGHDITQPVASDDKPEEGTPSHEAALSPSKEVPPLANPQEGTDGGSTPSTQDPEHSSPPLLDAQDTYIVKHEYETQLEGQLTIRKREIVRLIRRNEVGDWCEVVNALGEIGWVPTSYIAKSDNLEKQPWYHGNITRAEAESTLSNTGALDGSYLVRESQTKRGEYSISLWHEGQVRHYQIRKEALSEMYYVSPNSPFATLEELIGHHSQVADGLNTTLQRPVPDPHRRV